MTDAVTALPTVKVVAPARPVSASIRIAAVDWARGLVMLLMVIDHAAMAFDGTHDPLDSAMYPDAMTVALPAGEFLTRWITHICAPTFVFLAGLSLALSIERKVARGVPAWEIDRFILVRGLIIALLDPTLVSIGSGRLTFQVLFAIGVSMMCMAALRRLPWPALLAIGTGWFAVGEWITALVWHPPGSASVPAAFLVATYGGGAAVIKYPVIPWLAMMALGWAFGKHISRAAAGKTTFTTPGVLVTGGLLLLAVFVVVRAHAGYGDMWLHRADTSWQQWLHVSKYPPSLTYASLELGLMWVMLAVLMRLEPIIGVRANGPFLVFGQTAMFFYLAHRLAFEVPATWLGWRGAGGLGTTYAVSAVALAALYPACRWYRRVKAAHPASVLKYL
jgi:uncharacterized membrane protein